MVKNVEKIKKMAVKRSTTTETKTDSSKDTEMKPDKQEVVTVAEETANLEETKDPFFIHKMILFVAIAALLIFNQTQIGTIVSGLDISVPLSSGSGSSGLLTFSGSGDKIVGPQLQADGKTTKLVEWPTISSYDRHKSTGDTIQDAMNYVVPTGIPWYATEGQGAELLKGISFDDPITSQKVLAGLTGSNRFGTANNIELSADEEVRYNKLTGIFTCDYCCGGPSQVTRISQCGCAHAYAWKGLTRFLIKYYGDKYSDEEILGELTKWKGLWYPKGMISDYLLYTGQSSSEVAHGGSAGHQGGAAAGSSDLNQLKNLPGMVGGC